LQTERSVASEFAQYAFTIVHQKNLAGRDRWSKVETRGRPLRLKRILQFSRHKIRWTAMSGWPERQF